MGVEFKLIDIDLIGFSPLREKGAPASPSPDKVRSMTLNGVTDIIVVRPSKYGSAPYELIKGEAVWIAAQRALISSIQCAVRDNLSDDQAAYLIKEDRRHSFTQDPITEAESYKALMEREQISKAEVGRRFGKTRTVISRLIGLLYLDPWVKEEIRAGRLDYTHARLLAHDRLSQIEQRHLAEQCIEQEATTRQLVAMVKSTIEGLPAVLEPASPHTSQATEKNKDKDIIRLEQQLGEIIGCPVDIEHSNGAGELKIKYSNLDILSGVLERLGYEA